MNHYCRKCAWERQVLVEPDSANCCPECGCTTSTNAAGLPEPLKTQERAKMEYPPKHPRHKTSPVEVGLTRLRAKVEHQLEDSHLLGRVHVAKGWWWHWEADTPDGVISGSIWGNGPHATEELCRADAASKGASA